jgi:hypothetical protein
MFGRDKAPKVPTLTRKAQALSRILVELEPADRERAILTIQSILGGMFHLDRMPASVVDNLWSIICTVAPKAMVGQKPERLRDELEAGLDPEIRDLIVSQIRRGYDHVSG